MNSRTYRFKVSHMQRSRKQKLYRLLKKNERTMLQGHAQDWRERPNSAALAKPVAESVMVQQIGGWLLLKRLRKEKETVVETAAAEMGYSTGKPLPSELTNKGMCSSHKNAAKSRNRRCSDAACHNSRIGGTRGRRGIASSVYVHNFLSAHESIWMSTAV